MLQSVRAYGSAKYILTGFALVLALTLAVGAGALTRMADLRAHLQQIVQVNTQKTQLLSDMRHHMRERVIRLQAMALTDDLFIRDMLNDEFMAHATQFNIRRARLLELPLGERERSLLERLQRSIAESGAARILIVDALAADRTAEAARVLREGYTPAQQSSLALLEEMIALQREATTQAETRAERESRDTMLLLAGLCLAALALGIAVAALVARVVKRAETSIFNEKELAQVTLHCIGDAVITTDGEGNIRYLNPVAERLTGWQTAVASGHPLGKVFRVVDAQTRAPVNVLNEDEIAREGRGESLLLIGDEARECPIENSCAPIRNREGYIVGNVLVFRDVSKAQYLAQQLSWQASHDALTGLVNRHEFERRLTQLLETAQRDRKAHALLYMDLDQFKIVNDTCGHAAGDQLLLQLAVVLQQKIRERDVVARLGGDEFGVLLEGCPLDQARRVADNLLEAVNDFRFIWQDKYFEIGASIGVVPITADTESMARAMSTADAACYAAKDEGRNRVHVFEPDDRELAQRHGEMQWLSRINRAFDDERFRLYYQGIAPAAAPGVFTHYEVLLAMVDEKGGLVPPMAFIPAAERYGLMPNVDRWVIRNLFARHGEQWRDCRAQTGGDQWLYAVNISGVSLSDDQFLHFLREHIDAYEVPPKALCFEVTETAAITNLAKASRFMRELRGLGCHFALDDFGSGMSSFHYLKSLPVDYIKIDGAFVRDMVHDPMDHALVEAINRIGHVLGLKTIAESVETPEILAAVRALGIDYAQGFSLHRPQLFSELISPATVLRSGVR